MIHLVLLFIFLQASPHRGLEPVLPPAPYPPHSLRRLPQCPPAHLSHPTPLSLTLSLSSGSIQPRPPVPPPQVHVTARGSSCRGSMRNNSCRMVMVSEFLVPSAENVNLSSGILFSPAAYSVILNIFMVLLCLT